METSEALQNYAQEKIDEKIKKFVTKPIEAKINFDAQKQSHRAHLTLKAGDGFSIDVEHTCDDMYASVDHLVHKLSMQLKRQKDRLKEHKNKPTVKHLTVAEVTPDPVDAEDIIRFEEGKKKAQGGT